MNKKLTGFKGIFIGIVPILLLMNGHAYSQARNCDFYGQAIIRGVPVTGSETITAYDPGGQLCGTAYYVGGGNYAVHVAGDDPSTTGVDEGASDGDAISFRINGELADVTGGSNTWYNMQSFECDINIPDVPPEADPGGPYSGMEGTAVVFNGSGSIGAATFDWDFGDGSPHGSGISPTHVYSDNGTYTVTLMVSNGSGQDDTEATTATISNAAPTVNAGNDQAITEGNAISLDPATFTDPAVGNDTYTATIDWGDGVIEDGVVTPPSSDGEVDGAHTYVDDGVFTVTVTVFDEDGGEGNDTFTATVNNIPPTVEAGGDQTVNEGTVVNFNGGATDPGVNDVLTYNWNFGDGNNAPGQNVSHTYGDNGIFNVVLTVNDGDDDGTDNLTVTVNNVAPTAEAGGPYTGMANLPVQFNGSSTDPGSNDVLTYAWDLDNDGQYDDFIGQNATRTFPSTGTYTISLRVSDDDGGFDTDDATVEIYDGVFVTFDTEPQGLQLIVDGSYYTTPQTLVLVPGTTHTLEAPNTQGEGDGFRYVYDSWDGYQGRIHDFVTPGSNVTYKAFYNYQFYLDINTSGRGGNPVGEGWYNEGTEVTISIDSEVLDAQGTTRYLFSNWTGYGNGAYTGNDRQPVVVMNGAINQIVSWTEEYRLVVDSPFGEVIGGGWYSPGSTATFSVDTLIDLGQGRRHFFQSWDGSGAGSYTGPDNPGMVVMNGPIIETAVWQSQYFLDLISEYGSPTGEGWYDAGDTAYVEIDTVVDGGLNTRVQFLRWEGVGLGAYSGESNTFQVSVDGPITETAQWGVQYYLSLNSVWGNPIGEGWYQAGTLVIFSIDSIVAVAAGERYSFAGWEGVGPGSYSGENREPGIVIQGPVEEVAQWEHQFFVSLTIDPEWGGMLTPITAPGGWAQADNTLELTAVGNVDSSYGFSHWTGDAAGTGNPLMLVLDGPKNIVAHFSKGRVIVDTDPTGLRVLVDGQQFIAPVVFNWPPGDNHRLRAVTPQGDNIQTQFTFSRWSDGGLIEHDIAVTEDLVTYTAFFDASYYVNVESEYGMPIGEGWYLRGDQASISIDEFVPETEGIRRKFTGWVGTGEGAVTGPDRNIIVTVNGPLTERAQWQPQFNLTVTTFPPVLLGAEVTVNPAGPWYDPGSQVVLEAVVTDTGNTFTGWSGSVSDTTNPLILIVNSPMDVVANFNTFNQPPEISAIPGMSVMEDGVLRLSFAWLSQFVTDPNDPFQWLVFDFQAEPHLTLQVDVAEEEVIITPDANWNGVEEIAVTVTDPVGMSASGTVTITVISVPDPPGAFELVFPVADTAFTGWDSPIAFMWEPSGNLDQGDKITYSFYFSLFPDLTGFGTIRMSLLEDTELVLVPQPDGVYYWGVRAEDKQGYETWCEEIFILDVRTRVESNTHSVPVEFGLQQNFPNPFNPETTIRYQLPEPGSVKLCVYDMRGTTVRVLVEGKKEPGHHQVIWNARDEQNRPVASGVYLLRIVAGHFIQQRKMILLR